MDEYINMSDDEISEPIYRIISFERLVGIFKSKQMPFVKPDKWDDPFENIIAKTIIEDFGTGGRHSFHELGIRKNSHGVCWTRNPSSDAIWRIYSYDKRAVRIESTPALLFRNISKWLKDYPKSRLYIGKVDYYNKANKEIKQKAIDYARAVRSGELFKAAAESLLYKRKPFSHEDEVRAILIDQYDMSKDGVLNVNVDPHDIIQSVEIDPRASTEIVDVYKTYLINALKFKGNISKSNLYDAPRRIKVKWKRN
jgi:hypothetical protein